MSPGNYESDEEIRLGGAVLGPQRHICGFFRNPDEEYQVLLPFIKEGIERGERAFHVVNPKLYDDHVKRLNSVGIDMTEAEKTGQLELCDWEHVYFRDGYFDQERMLAMWQAALDGAVQLGFPRTRLIAHMEWSLEKREGVTDLIEYEARFNLVHQHSRDPVICTYDLNKYSGDVIMDVLRTHPMIIIGNVLEENPFFTPPDQFLQELRDRPASHHRS